MPRPPEMTTRALVSSGRSDLVNSWETKTDRPASAAAAMSSMGAAAAPAGAGSKAVPRTVMTLMASFELTVARALPAYMGRTKVSASTTALISEIWATSRSAAMRGMTFLPVVVAAATRWL